MEDLLLALLEPLLEGLLELLVCGFLDVVVELLGVKSLLEDRRPVNPVVADAGFFATGAVIGIVSGLDFPGRLMPRAHTIPGISIVLAPLATGVAMHFFGHWRRKRGGHPSRLATFWGGGAFALGVALARFVIVGR